MFGEGTDLYRTVTRALGRIERLEGQKNVHT